MAQELGSLAFSPTKSLQNNNLIRYLSSSVNGIELVKQDNYGQVIAVLCKEVGARLAEEIEAMGIEVATRFAKEKWFQQIILEGNSSRVINACLPGGTK